MKKLTNFFVFLIVGVGFLSAASIVVLATEVELIPEHLKLKTSKRDILGSKEVKEGVIKYAYKNGKKVGNSPSIEIVKQARKNGLDIQGEVIEKRTKNSKTFRTNKRGYFVSEFISGEPQYYKDGYGQWWEADYATTTRGMFNRETKVGFVEKLFVPKVLAAATSTFYPDADAETNTVDGSLQNELNASWSTGREEASADNVYDSVTESVSGGVSKSGVGTYNFYRSIYGFNTGTTISANSTILSATFSVYGNGSGNYDDFNDSYSYLSVVHPNPASDTSLSAGDWDSYDGLTGNLTEGCDSGERVDLTTFVGTAQYYDFDLNSTGKNWIGIGAGNKTWLGTAEGHDIEDQDIGVGSSIRSIGYGYYADESGTDKDPKLVVVYITPGEQPVATSLKAYKSPDQATSTRDALMYDSDLAVLLSSANSEYIVDGLVFATAASVSPDLKIGFNAPDGSTIDLSYIAHDSGDVGKIEDETASSEITLTANDKEMIQINGTIKTGSATGTLYFMWAQNNSDSDTTTVQEGSYLRVEEI